MVIRIVIFAKAPLPGLAKTRLIPAIGHEGSARLAVKLLQHAVDQAVSAQLGPVELCVSPSASDPLWNELGLPSSVEITEQSSGDLGERMSRVTKRVIDNGESIILVGTDCPGLTAEKMREAALALNSHDVCLVPVSDGGYALLGLNEHLASLFSDMPWSTDSVAQLTRQRVLAEGRALYQLKSLHDIDRPQDLPYLPDHWQPFLASLLQEN